MYGTTKELHDQCQAWRKALSDDEINMYTNNDEFDFPHLEPYSWVKKESESVYDGEIGLGNITALRVRIFISPDSDDLMLAIKGHSGLFSYKDALSKPLQHVLIAKRLKFRFPWDAHLLAVNVHIILNRIKNGLSPSWERAD
jgi:hypothetical protein